MTAVGRVTVELPEDQLRAVIEWLGERPAPTIDSLLSRAEMTLDLALFAAETERGDT